MSCWKFTSIFWLRLLGLKLRFCKNMSLCIYGTSVFKKTFQDIKWDYSLVDILEHEKKDQVKDSRLNII